MPEAIKKSRRDLQLILKNINDGITIQTTSGEIIFANSAAARIIGFPSVIKLLKTPIKKIINNFEIMDEKGNKVGPESLPGRQAMIGKYPKPKIIKFLIKGSKIERWSLVRSTPVFVRQVTSKGLNKKVRFVINVFIDITRQKRAEDSNNFLHQASKLLFSSLNPKVTLKTVAKLAVPKIADWCTVDMLDDKGKLYRVAMENSDPKQVELAKKIQKMRTENYSPAMYELLRSGKPGFYPKITKKLILSTVHDKKYLKALLKLGIYSAIIVPLKARNGIFGLISFVSSTPKKLFNKDDLVLAEELATRAALAIDNARIYQEARNENLIREKTEIALRESEEKYRTLVDLAPDIIYSIAPDGTIIDLNPAFEKITGWKVNEFIGKPFISLIHPNDLPLAIEKFNQSLIGETPMPFELRLKFANGGYIVGEFRSVPKVQEGKIVGKFGISRDISERKEMERRKDEFISIASHELRTPITTIKGYLQILKKKLKGEGIDLDEVNNYLENVEISVERLVRLVNDLLDVSRINSGKLQINSQRFSINSLLDKVVTDMQYLTDHHHIIIKGDTMGIISADRDLISQVLVNLISNAIKYSPKADKIIIEVFDNTDDLTVSIQDFGIGIAKKNLSKVFDRFYQADTSVRGSLFGLGLGLYISNEIIKKHGGEMRVESEKGVGSTFYFSIPKVLLKESYNVSGFNFL